MTLEGKKIKYLILFTREGREVPVYLYNAQTEGKGVGFWRKHIDRKLEAEGLSKRMLQLKFKIVTTEGEEILVDLLEGKLSPQVARIIFHLIFKEKDEK